MKKTAGFLAAMIFASLAFSQGFAIPLTDIVFLSDSSIAFQEIDKVQPMKSWAFVNFTETDGETFETTISDEQFEVIKPKRAADALKNWQSVLAAPSSAFVGKRVDGRKYLFRRFAAKD